MKWVKFSERFPKEDDKSSVSSDGGQVIVRGKWKDRMYANLVSIEDCHDWGVDMKSEWLEGAFESETEQ